MTGSMPSAGKTPRAGGNPWSSAGPEATWWRDEGDEPVALRVVPPAYGGDAEPDDAEVGGDRTGAAGERAVGRPQDDEPEPDRYDEPTIDVLGERAAAAEAAESPPTDSRPVPAEPATVAAAAMAEPAQPQPADVDARVADAAEPRLAALPEVAHPEAGDERLPGYAERDDPVGGKNRVDEENRADDEENPADEENRVDEENPADDEETPAVAGSGAAAASVAAGPGDAGSADQAGSDPESGAARWDADRYGAEHPTVGVPEVMVLPEPGRNRRREWETVVLPRGPVPDQSRPGRLQPEHGKAAGSKLETSTFWLLDDQTDESRVRDGAVWPPTEGRNRGSAGPASRLGVPPRRRDLPRPPRKPASGLVALLLLGMAATFFAWVSAGPLWLAVGHGNQGTATVIRCTGDGVGQRCVGEFTAERGTFTAPNVALMGVAADQRDEGAVVPARMVDRQARQAYVGSAPLLLHLRWGLGVLLVLLCGIGIAAVTGARRLETVRARRGAVLLSLAGPLALLAGFLVITY